MSTLLRRVRALEAARLAVRPAEIRAVVEGRPLPHARAASLELGRRCAEFVAAARAAVEGSPDAVIGPDNDESLREGEGT